MFVLVLKWYIHLKGPHVLSFHLMKIGLSLSAVLMRMMAESVMFYLKMYYLPWKHIILTVKGNTSCSIKMCSCHLKEQAVQTKPIFPERAIILH